MVNKQTNTNTIMVKSFIISASKANQLYWLGRYQERVYMTLHQFRKCYDQMIDGKPEDYQAFWDKLDVANCYSSNEDFTLGMLYDENNPSSILSALNRAMDNAILLREDIFTETLSYIELSISLMKKCKLENKVDITLLQYITDWSLAFWGSAEQRIYNSRILAIMMIGRHVEYLDMMMRYNYDFKRISLGYKMLKKYLKELPASVDSNIASQLDVLLTEEAFDLSNDEYKQKLIKYINQMMRI